MAKGKVDKLPPDQRDYLLGLFSEGVGIISASRLFLIRFPQAPYQPPAATLQKWIASPEVQAEIDAGQLRVRSRAPGRSFASAKQQANALITMSEKVWGLFMEASDAEKPNITTLCKLGAEVRENFRSIRETLSPFQTTQPEVVTSFERLMGQMMQNVKNQPTQVREAFGLESN